MEKKRVAVRIEGLVQGVCFRASTKEAALGEGVRGWVKNLPDGRVQALFEGYADAVDRMVLWCNKGNSYSRVKRVEVLEEEYRGDFSRFEIRY
jgi:acylphosphatase